MTDLLQVFILAMTPIGELRLSIPMGMAYYHLPTLWVFLVSVAGNFLPAFFLLLFLNKVSPYLSKKSKLFCDFFGWCENRAKNNHSEKLKSYGAVGLALFIAVPLPITGAWSGALLATIMNLPLKKSIPAVLSGIIGAGTIVTILMMLGINMEKYFGWPTLIAVMLSAGLFVLIYKSIKRKNQKYK